MLDLEKRVWKQKTLWFSTLTIFFIDMVAAPPVGFNLTFVCPDGQVMSYVFLCSLGKIIIMIRCSTPTGLPPPL